MTDTETEVRYDPASKPGVSNLARAPGRRHRRDAGDLADRYTSYGPLKADLSAALIELLAPRPGPLRGAHRRSRPT